MVDKLRFPWKIASLIAVLIVAALFLRLDHITDNQFLFYDEGMYLGYNRNILNLIASNPPKDLSEFFRELFFIGILERDFEPGCYFFDL